MFKTQNKKEFLLAFRPVLFIFVSIILAILGAYFFITYNIIGFCLCLGLILFVLGYMIYRTHYKACIVALLLCACSVSAMVIDYIKFNNGKLDENTIYTISGRADEVCYVGTNSYTRTLHNCTIKIGDEVICTGKNVQVALIGNNVECGDIITFKAKLSNPEYFEDIGASLCAYKNIDYTTMLYYDNIISLQKDNLSIREVIKLRALNILRSNMSNEGATLAYAVVFGDKTFLDYDVKNAFIESGIAHVLAVSGLHTSLIFALLIFILKKVRIKYGYKLAIIATFIGFFTYLCDFAPSIVRSSIMAIILAFTYLRSAKYDIINILSFAGVVILIFQPLQLFNVGFVLSFACMMSMILFDPVGNRLTAFIPNSQIQSLLVSSITTTVGTLPVMALYFGKLSLTCIVANVVLLPVFVYAYTFLFVVVVISLFLPLSFLLHIIDFVMITIIKICVFLTLPKNDYVRIFKLGLIGELLSFVLIFTITNHFNMKKKYKIPFNVSLAIIVAFCAVYASIPKMENNSIEKIAKTSSVYYFNNNCLLFEPFSSNNDYNSTKKYLEKHNLYDIETMFVIDYNFINVNKIEFFTSEFKIENIYLSQEAYVEMQYYLEHYFTNSKVYVLEENVAYEANVYKFYYVKLTDESGVITIKNGDDVIQFYSKRATV